MPTPSTVGTRIVEEAVAALVTNIHRQTAAMHPRPSAASTVITLGTVIDAALVSQGRVSVLDVADIVVAFASIGRAEGSFAIVVKFRGKDCIFDCV